MCMKGYLAPSPSPPACFGSTDNRLMSAAIKCLIFRACCHDYRRLSERIPQEPLDSSVGINTIGHGASHRQAPSPDLVTILVDIVIVSPSLAHYVFLEGLAARGGPPSILFSDLVTIL